MDSGWRLLILGAWIGIDAAAFLQIMVSQPLVAGWLAGLAVGAPGTGLAVGILLQGLWARALPLGGTPLPAAGIGTLVAGALAAGTADAAFSVGPLALPQAPVLAVSLAVGMLVAEAGRAGNRLLARHHAGLARKGEAAAERGDAAALSRLNALGILESAGAGVLLTAGGLALGSGLLQIVPRDPGLSGLWVGMPVLGIGLGQALSMIPRRAARMWAGAAVVLTAAGWVLW